MNSKQINLYPIQKYLASLNIYPAKDHGYYAMYHSPFREDKEASLKVDYNKNLWIDFGTTDGGTLIDLVMRINKCTSGEAIQLLERHIGGLNSNFFSFQGNRSVSNTKSKDENKESNIVISKIIALTHPSLFEYLKERCIDSSIASQHCREVHYGVNGKNYFALGFKNDGGGYELRNKYFKGCTSKNITTYTCIDNQSDTCVVFEGFFDYLSYLSLRKQNNLAVNAVILNSISNLSKAMNFIQSHAKVYTFLDNDEAGQKATSVMKKHCPNLSDQSAKYSKYKDLNEYLISSKRAQKETQKRKPSRGLKR